jgi:polysaccharide export outer membrane protein
MVSRSLLRVIAALLVLVIANPLYGQVPFVAPIPVTPQSQAQPSVAGQAPLSPQMTDQPRTGAIQLPQQTMQQMTADQVQAFRSMSPEQRRAFVDMVQGSGGMLTPQVMEMLQGQEDLSGISVEEIMRGREAMERREKRGSDRRETDSATGRLLISSEPQKPRSLFERMQRTGRYQEISTILKPFGYEFFQEAAVRIITDRKDIPVPAQYVVGPGDEVKILLWGRVNAQYTLPVDRNGNITIPQIGPVPVAGMTFQQMSERLVAHTGQIVGANIDVTMGALKTIPIFVLGDVKRPGAYTIGSFATITDALLISGGPSDIGSMRNVQLKRNGKVVTSFDLYNLLIKGDKSRDLVLQAGDVVFVPVVGKLVGIAGNVKRPAIYELKDLHDLQNMFDLAGGIIPTAYTQQIQVERIVRNERSIIVDINDKNLTRAREVLLQDGDLVKVFNIVDKNVNMVQLSGNVKRSGKYEHKPGMRIKDLLKEMGDLMADTYMSYALIKRQEGPSATLGLIPFSLNELLLEGKESANLELKPQDMIFVFSKWYFRDKPVVYVEGEVRAFQLTLTAALARQASFGRDSAGRREDFSRTNATQRDGLSVAERALLDEYRRKRGEAVPDRSFGQEGMTGRDNASDRDGLSVAEQALLQDYRQKKGEVSRDVFPPERKPGTADDQKYRGFDEVSMADGALRVGDIPFREGQIIRGGQPASERPYPEDQSQARQAGVGMVPGESRRERTPETPAVEVPFRENMTVRDAILGAGGITRDAYLAEMELYRTDEVTRRVTSYRFNLQKALDGDVNHNVILKNLDRIVVKSASGFQYRQTVRIDGDVYKPGVYRYADRMRVSDLIFAAGNVLESAYMGEAEVSTQVVEDKRNVRVMNRTFDLAKALSGDPQSNVELKPYDVVMVKRLNNWRTERFVNIQGEVTFPGKYFVRSGETLASLIERAGGYAQRAYLRGAVFTRIRVKETQRKALDELILRLEKDIASAGAAAAETSLTADVVAAKKAELESKQKFVEVLKKTEPTGRMAIKLSHLRLLKGSEFDVELEDGDALYIPVKSSAITVAGSTMSQASFVYVDSMDYKSYIEMAGGFTRYADSGNVFILKVDGTAQKAGSRYVGWSESRSRWEVTGFQEETRELEPGDTIIVPEKVERIAWLRELKDWTQTLMQLAIMGASMRYLFKGSN